MPRGKIWHVWRVVHTDRHHDIIASGPQQARKVAAALWMTKYNETKASCISTQLPVAEAHGPRLAPGSIIDRFGKV